MTRAIYASTDPVTGKPRAAALGCGWFPAVPAPYSATMPVAIIDGPNGVQVFSDSPPATPATVLAAIAADAVLDASAATAQAAADAAAAVTSARSALFAATLQSDGSVPQTSIANLAALSTATNPVHATLANGTLAMAFATNTSVKVTPTATGTLTTTVPAAGAHRHLVILTAGTTSFTLTFGAGFKPTGTLATGTVAARVFVLSWISDGASLYEVSRTAAMAA